MILRTRFRAIGTRGAAKGIKVHQFVWTLMLTRDHLWHFLEQKSFADNIVQLHGELELQQMLNKFFDRAVYYRIQGYDDAARQESPKSGVWASLEELPISIGLKFG